MTLYRRQGSRPSPRERNAKKAKWLSEEALQIAVKRREAKRKGEKERYSHLNKELQRIARKEKKAFLTNQCKEIEENNRRGKTRDLFKIIRDIKGTFQASQFSSVQSLSRVRLFETLRIVARHTSLSITNSRSLLKLMPIESVMPSSHLILCHPLLLLPLIPPSIRVFSNESTLCMR